MKNNKLLLILILMMGLTFVWRSPSLAAMSKMSASVAPHHNPHPAETKEDKARVDFAKRALELMNDKTTIKKAQSMPMVSGYMNQQSQFNVDKSCLKKPAQCLQNRQDVAQVIRSVYKSYGPILEYKFLHVVPWSFEKFKKTQKLSIGSDSLESSVTAVKKAKTNSRFAPNLKKPLAKPLLERGEFMIHAYVNFEKQGWHHVDIIISEDSTGELLFKRYFIIKIPSVGNALPPGVVC